MRRAALATLMVIVPALGLGAAPAPSQEKSAAEPQANSVRPAVPLQEAADPARLADPKATPDAKSPVAIPVDQGSYRIGAQDVLLIRVWREKDFDNQYMVRPDGKFDFPFIGEVVAAGLTPQELIQQITKRLTTYIKEPQVNIQLTGIHSRRYFIQGEVNKPGEADLVVPTTVMQGLVAAGGFRDFADQKHIIIMRGDKRLKFNYVDVYKGKNLQQNILLEPDDIIVVK